MATNSWCVAFPALPGKTALGAKEVPEEARARMDEYVESRQNAGITMERVYLMPTPGGDFFVLYGEGTTTFPRGRAQELRESRTAVGITRDQAWITETPMGDFCCVYLEGPDPVSANEAWSQSTKPYDTWFREQAGAIMGIDFNQPLPPVETVWEYPPTH